jgi:hypothetical protein
MIDAAVYAWSIGIWAVVTLAGGVLAAFFGRSALRSKDAEIKVLERGLALARDMAAPALAKQVKVMKEGYEEITIKLDAEVERLRAQPKDNQELRSLEEIREALRKLSLKVGIVYDPTRGDFFTTDQLAAEEPPDER